jgi:DNA-binding HxlR family transcriptional regulator
LLKLLVKKGTKEILLKIRAEPKHFNQLMIELRHTIARKTLARRIKELEKAGLIERTIVPRRPVGTQYSLSDRGKNILELFLQFENKLKQLDLSCSKKHD